MTDSNRGGFLRAVGTAAGATAAMTTFPPVIARALSIPAARRTGTLAAVEHIVIPTQETRSFDHYFGTLNGVLGFAARFPIPVPDAPGIVGKSIWYQSNQSPTGTPVSSEHRAAVRGDARRGHAPPRVRQFGPAGGGVRGHVVRAKV